MMLAIHRPHKMQDFGMSCPCDPYCKETNPNYSNYFYDANS